jgi:hypothetical protein
VSNPLHLRRARPAAAALAVGLALAAVPAVAQASAVGLGTSAPFAVLGGSSVTNTGPSVLNGDLGVSPGTSLTGFGLPAVVNGATHANDAVAGIAQNDLTTAYDVAAGQPVAPGDVLTGQDLGGLTLVAGAYRFDTSAGLTGALTLDAEGDPNAQFVFEIGSTLITASASSVLLVNGASPCNVYWQVGSSATLGTTTAFAGNVLANQDISLDNGATVQGRLLAKRGITLIDNVVDGSRCGTSSTPPSATPATGAGPVTAAVPPARNGTAIFRQPPRSSCASGFAARVRGRMIERVVFSLDRKRIRAVSSSPFRVFVRALPGRHNVTARVTFKDATRARTLSLGYRACAAAVLAPRRGPSQFTG